MVDSKTAVYDMSMVNPVTCLFSLFFKAFMILLKCNFSGLLKDTDSMQGHAAQIFKCGTIVQQCFNVVITIPMYEVCVDNFVGGVMAQWKRAWIFIR